ncbi:hypothetical protein RchiOBHm_Chr4g0426251 [Rosa chinensis]|uniref:Uncharacterized protein n=1 Tax=Rosa chinensis TaxID=74649 RepID=A0A2P6QZD5_ROSCH|nr:hypothetical protein RchiOBHm_Chr4g0426251 [Rosa chinensis]
MIKKLYRCHYFLSFLTLHATGTLSLLSLSPISTSSVDSLPNLQLRCGSTSCPDSATARRRFALT